MRKIIFYGLIVLAVVVLTGFVHSDLFSESEKILATVGEKVITQNDLNEYLKRYEGMKRGRPFSLEEKKNHLNTLIQNTLVATDAEREKMDKKPEVQSRLKLIRDEILANEYVSTKILPSIKVSDAEVDELLKQGPDLIAKETLTLKEIQVKTGKEAEEIYQKLKKGAEFSKLVEEKSIAPSKANGGLVGPVSRGQLPPTLEAAIFGLKQGEFTKPLESEGVFSIYYLVNRKERDPEETKRLQARLREKVFQIERNKKIVAIVEKRVEELKKEIKVETHFDQLQ